MLEVVRGVDGKSSLYMVIVGRLVDGQCELGPNLKLNLIRIMTEVQDNNI